ncbi:MAG: hypothetical protein JRH20_06635, partial [Deltaproteobacteria bacterium]|nr:hypothetical protein [Deltaproteobacteria bacterium]
MSRLACTLGALVLVASCGGGQRAAPAMPIHFIGKGEPDALTRRLAVELKAAQIRAVLISGFGLPDTELARLAQRQGAQAGVLVRRGPGRAQWLVVFVLSKEGTISRHVVVRGAAETSWELVLRAVETLRAELLPLPDFLPRADAKKTSVTRPSASRPASRPASPSAASSQQASSQQAKSQSKPVFVRKIDHDSKSESVSLPSRRFSLSVSGGMSYGPGGVDPFAQAGVALGWRFIPGWELRLRTLLPMGGPRIETRSGSSAVYAGLASVGVHWLP